MGSPRVEKTLNKQNPLIDNCPTCNQQLPNNINAIYSYFQNINDTEKQIGRNNEIRTNLKGKKGTINSLKIKIKSHKRFSFSRL